MAAPPSEHQGKEEVQNAEKAISAEIYREQRQKLDCIDVVGRIEWIEDIYDMIQKARASSMK